MRDEPHEEADDADAEHQSVEEQETNNAAARPRERAEPKVDQGKHDAQKRDDDGDHSRTPSAKMRSHSLAKESCGLSIREISERHLTWMKIAAARRKTEV
jgi:hypothetical protein